MRYGLFAVILILGILGSGTAVAGIGMESSAKANDSLPALSALSPGGGSSGAPSDQLGEAAFTTSASAKYFEQAPPQSEQQQLLPLDVKSSPPTSVYFNGQSMGWSDFSTIFPASSPVFWIPAAGGWSWYATAPFGGWIQQLLYIPGTGTLKVYEIYPSGKTQMTSFGWAYKGYKYIWFYADVPGRHTMLFTVTDLPSNAVIIDVYPNSLTPSPRPPGSIRVGDQFTKSVRANPSTGYQWEAVFDTSIINLISSRFVPDQAEQ